MAKNKKNIFDSKNVKINEEELSITKIGEITTSEQNPIFTILLFVILLGFIFVLPTIVNFFNKGEEKPDYSLPTNSETKPNEEEEEKTDFISYDFNEALVIPLEEKITIENFRLEEESISFTIFNNSDSRYNLNERNYFLEIYTEENTLLERVILKKETILKDSSKNYTYKIATNTKNNMKKIMFVEKETTDYPNIELTMNDLKEEILVCTNETETITYKFIEQKLDSITDVVNYPYSQNENYNNTLENWQQRVAIYNNIKGISSTFIDSGIGFIVNTVIDLKEANLNNVNNENYYPYNTIPKIVKFEMDSRGFSCK